ncbi:MAG: NUDIX hydrolase [bacterium]
MSKEYKNPALTTDIILFSDYKDGEDLKVLFIKRKYEPFKNKWAFPGGFVEYNEELEEAAKRELEEETSIKDVCLKQLGAFGRVGRDPRGRTVSVVYYASVNSSELFIKAQDDAKDAQWFSVNKLPELAFDHAEIIAFALETLKSEIKKSFDNIQENL